MTLRHLVVAALLVGAGAAKADVIPSAASSQPGFLSGWTTGNGTDILGSGVLAGNLNLIGGISYSGTGGEQTSLTDVLYGKTSATVAPGADGQTTLFFTRGIEGTYLLGSGHGLLAAMLGNGVSVIGSSDGVVVRPGTSVGGNTGGGSSVPMPVGSAPVLSPAPVASPAPVVGGGGDPLVVTAPGPVLSQPGAPSDPIIDPPATGAILLPGGSTLPDIVSPGSGIPGDVVVQDPVTQIPGLPDLEEPVSELPEPGSLALLLAGVLGAGAFRRRRAA